MAQPTPLKHSIREEGEAAPVLSPEESRQGVTSGRVILILVTSLALALIAFAIVYSAEIL
jgi:hypothetical protein